MFTLLVPCCAVPKSFDVTMIFNSSLLCFVPGSCFINIFVFIYLHTSVHHYFHDVCVVYIVSRLVQLVGQELLIRREHPSCFLVFSGVYIAQSLVFCVVFCRSLFGCLLFLIWSLCCPSLDILHLLAPLESSNVFRINCISYSAKK